MTQSSSIDDVVERHARAIVAMNIPQIMNDLEPAAMMKLQEQAGGGMAIRIDGYEVLGRDADGADWLYDVKYVGAESFTVRARWSRIGRDWKIVDADIVARD
jgi:hypothetical protein